MPWIVDTECDAVRVTFSGAATVGEAGAVRTALLELAGEARPVVIDLTPCTGVDCATVQLLLAFHGARSECGAPIRFVLGDGPAAARLERLRVAALVRMATGTTAPGPPPRSDATRDTRTAPR